ncbi:MAG: hypothetical protein ACTHK2_10925 [Dokdonella sp.]|uniref:hypothetical protein n=1 Tax=Dokdonella sp. TaxID=2291710 RepID=UPI003F81FF5D
MRAILAGAMLPAALLLTRATASPDVDVKRYEGRAYGADGAALLYRETHWLYRDNGVATRLVLYSCPDGPPFARKTLRDTGGASRPDFDFIDGRDGHREGARRSQGGHEIYLQERAGTPVRTRQFSSAPDVVVDAGFDAYIRSRWNSFAPGTDLGVRLLLPSRLAAVDVRVRDETTDADRVLHQRRLKVRLDAWYGFALPAMSLVYDDDRVLREFRGIGTIRDEHGRHQEMVIRFPRELSASAASEAELVAAQRVELSGHCP